MASRFWVGGTGTWDGVTTTHWAASSNGAGGQSVPGSGDTVTFDGSSGGGTVTMSASLNPTVTSITCGAFTGTLDFNANTVTCNTFSGTGTATRTINWNGGTLTLNGTASGTIYNFGTTTGLTYTAPVTINVTGNSTTSTRTLNGGSLDHTATSVNVSAGSDSFTLSNMGTLVSLDFTGYAGNWNAVTMTLTGNYTQGSSMTVVAGSNTLTFGGSSGTQVFKSNGVTFDRPVTINNAGATLQLFDAMTLGSTRTLTVTAGTFDVNSKALSVGLLSSSGTTARTISNPGTTWTITGSGSNLAFADTTNLTITWPTNLVFNDSSATAHTWRVSSTAGSVRCTSAITRTAGSGNIGSIGSYHSVDLTGWTGTAVTSSFNLDGDWVGVSSLTSSATATLTFEATSGTQHLTMGSTATAMPIVFNAPGATVQLQDTLTTTGNVTLTAGTLDENTKNITCNNFSSNNSNTRSWTNGAGASLFLTGTGTPLAMQTTTNMTATSWPTVDSNNSSSSNVTLSVSATAGSVRVTSTAKRSAGTGQVVFSGNFTSIDLTGWSGTTFGGTSNLTGDFTGTASMTSATTPNMTFTATSGTKTVTLNSSATGCIFTVNCPGATTKFVDLTTTGTFTLTAGTVDLNSQATVTTGAVDISNSNTRSIVNPPTTWVDTGDWTATTTIGLTFNAPGTLKQTATGAVAFAGGGLTYSNYWLAHGAGTGTLTVTGANTFADFKDDGTAAHQITFKNGITQTMTSFSVSGNSGALISLRSDSAGSQFTLSDSSGNNNRDYLDIQDSAATGGATWRAGAHSVNSGNNTGWNFNVTFDLFTVAEKTVGVRRDSRLELEITASVRVDSVCPTEDVRRQVIDGIAWDEELFGVAHDEGLLNDVLMGLPIDSSVNVDGEALLSIDRRIDSEWLIGQERRDFAAASEIETAVRASPVMQTESLIPFVFNSIANLELLRIASVTDAGLDLEALPTVTTRSQTQTEWTAILLVSADAAVPVEAGSLVAPMLIANGEVLHSTSISAANPTEIASAVRIDSNMAVEEMIVLYAVVSNGDVALEWQTGVKAGMVVIEATASVLGGEFSLATENTLTVTARSSTEAESSSLLSISVPVQAEASSDVSLTVILNTEETRSVAASAPAPMEQTLSVSHSDPIDGESISLVSWDGILWMEHFASVRSDHSVIAEANLGTEAGNISMPVEVLSSLSADFRPELDVQSSVAVDAILPHEQEALLRWDGRFDDEDIFGVRADHPLVIEALPAVAAGGVAAEFGSRLTVSGQSNEEHSAAIRLDLRLQDESLIGLFLAMAKLIALSIVGAALRARSLLLGRDANATLTGTDAAANLQGKSGSQDRPQIDLTGKID